MSEHVKQIKDIRALCRLMLEHQEVILMFISNQLDELEASFSDSGEDTNSHAADEKSIVDKNPQGGL
jgi:hypothetical protein